LRKPSKLNTGKWFSVEADRLECRICHGRFGGGSSTRPCGSGLRSHLSQMKNTCCRMWTNLFWDEAVESWNRLDEEYKLALLVRWVTL